ncbi:MAG: hypothetical protein LBG96_16790, partial [Tannerella sp.]|nr:hypothetical protein [Tannerella sp.]
MNESILITKRPDGSIVLNVDGARDDRPSKSSFRITRTERDNVIIWIDGKGVYSSSIENVSVNGITLTPANFVDETDGLNDSKGGAGGDVDFSEYVKDVDPRLLSEISLTNLVDQRYFKSMGIASNGRTYFMGEYTYGLWLLNDETGEINAMSLGSAEYTFRTMGIASNGRTYLVSSAGIRVLDNEIGDTSPTNVTDWGFKSMGIASNGRTYFLGDGYDGNNGIMVLDDATGDIVPANVTSGGFKSMGIASNGRTYFLGDGYDGNNGILVLDDATGDIELTNMPDVRFDSMGIASDGRTYFCGSAGVYVLDDATGDIVPTNVTGWGLLSMGIASDGRMYFFGGGGAGIWVLDDVTGDIVRASMEDHYFSSLFIAPNGRTYFLGTIGLLVLNDESGEITRTGFTDSCFDWAMGIASDGKAYLYGDYGIYLANFDYVDKAFVRKPGGWYVANYTEQRIETNAGVAEVINEDDGGAVRMQPKGGGEISVGVNRDWDGSNIYVEQHNVGSDGVGTRTYLRKDKFIY